MNRIIVLVGRSAVGKTTLEKLLEKDHDFVPLISHTSRPPREGEIEGNEYYFTNNEEISKMVAAKQVLENVEYTVNGELWYYALAREEFLNKQKVSDKLIVTINPHGVAQLLEHQDFTSKMIVVYMVAEDNLQFRYYAREHESLETAKKWKQRKYQDDVDFEIFEKEIIPKMQAMRIPVIKYDNTLNDRPTMENEDVLDFIRIIDQYLDDEENAYRNLNDIYFNI